MFCNSIVKDYKDSKKDIVIFLFEESICPREIEDTLNYSINDLIDKKEGEVTVIHTLGKYAFKKFIFVGLGNINNFSIQKFKTLIKKNICYFKQNCLVDITTIRNKNIKENDLVNIFIETYLLTNYHFHGIEEKENLIPEIDLIVNETDESFILDKVQEACFINMARNLINMPSNYLKQEDFTEYVKQIAKKINIQCEILGNKQLESIGAGGILAVNKGSNQEAKLIILRYKGIENEPFKAIIGKGVIYDSGGYCLKPSTSQITEKADMSGAASVLATIAILAKKKAKCNIMAIMPIVENLIGKDAYKCDDVITMLSGKTVEITNTDAEGRLILADSITYACNQKEVESIIDIATLTGACAKALGNVYTGIFSNSDEFYEKFKKASEESYENIWRLPINKEYTKELKDTIVADIKNSGGNSSVSSAGASVAAGFLSEFLSKDMPWIHLDIAGTALENKSATGVMIKTMAKFLEKK